MSTGIVKHWDDDRGFGFILPDDSSEDLFVHVSNLRGSAAKLREGQRVRFERQPNPKRPGRIEAANVALV